jgi:hypothetical protein
MSTELHRARWSRPLAGIACVAVLGAGLGAFFGIRAVAGAGSGASSGQPAARVAAAMAYDASNGTVVLFGGQSRSRSLNDTWTWDGSGWTQARAATSPPPMDNAQMTYDPVTHDVLLVGSQQVEGSNIGPIACSGGSGSSGSSSGSSGSTSTFIPPGNPIPAIAPVPSAAGSAKQGLNMVPPACATYMSPSAATWLWNGTDWSKASGSTPDVVFGSGTLATDPVTGRAVLLTRGPFAEPALGSAQPAIACPMQIGGTQVTQPQCPVFPIVAPMWTWNGHQWKVIPSSATTTAFDSIASSIVDDAVTGRLATFGGNFIAPIPEPLPCQGCVTGPPVKQAACCTGSESIWNGTVWKQITTYRNGPATPGATFVGDPAAKSDLLLTGDGQTWLWTGAWTRMHPGTTPPITSGVASAFDAATGQVVLFGGAGVTSRVAGWYDQTWTWNGSDWSRRAGSSGPSVTIPIPSPVSVPPGLPCNPIAQPAQPVGTTAPPQPQTICNGISGGGAGSTGSASGVSAGSGVVAP